MNKQVVYILKGLPGAGKSTWARKEVLNSNGKTVRINKDSFREMLHAGVYSKENEINILKIRDNLIKFYLIEDKNIIIDDTNFEEKHIAQIKFIVSSYRKDAEIIEKYFYICPVEACKRQEYRPAKEQVPHEVIWRMYEKYIKPQEYKTNKVLAQDPRLPKGVICDLDGTLAIHQKRNPYDCTKADEDLLRSSLANILFLYEEQGYHIIFVSGRNEGCREVTEQWLILHGFRDFILHMREDGDNRKDSLIKEEIFYNCIYDYFYIDCVFDDRQQVVDMWRQKIGLTCYQVDYGNF